MTHGASLVTTTTTLPHGHCPSDNCQADCLFLNGGYYVNMFDVLDGACHPTSGTRPDCSVCSSPYCFTTTTTAQSTTTTGP